MLTKSNSANQPQGCSSKNEMNDQHNQQEALASLFRSLSNLANGNAQMPSNQLLNMDNCPPSNLMSQTFRNLQTHDTASPSSSQSSIHPSLHGVVAAAAIMQQQLVTAALSQDQTRSANNNIYNYSSQLQTNNQVAFLNDHMSAGYPTVSQTSSPINLEHEVQSASHSNQAQQQPQRINYCTICNKELCNKYFMKTHMLKMHGINLEVDQLSNEEEAGQSHASDNITQDSNQHHLLTAESNNSSKNVTEIRQPHDGQHPNTKTKSSATPGSSSTTKPTTSVMNGFAGNSMGGVVCDICNKELCSKYFLKVHKQNTHGIATDYQDANQFVYPFSNTLANPFMPASKLLPFSLGKCFNHISSSPINDLHGEFKSKPSSAKRARTSGNVKQSRDRAQSGNDQHFDSIYRLMINQSLQPGAACGQSPVVSSSYESAGTMNALMCFGAINPFGPAGISPTMVVDMILRNQHLINRNKGLNQPGMAPGKCPPGKSSKDSNNNDSKQAKSTSSKSAKESTGNNSRYFTHYTEACPMCDRRFKSIKWLKTHMMNDHKQEIGTYMQMIMQNMYSNGSQAPAQITARLYDQASGYPLANFGHRNIAALLPNHQQQHQQTITYNTLQPQSTGALQTDQYNIVQNYLNQQRQMRQQHHHLHSQEMNVMKSEPIHSDHLIKRPSGDVSSPTSAEKASPRSMTTGLDFEDDNQQLDLTMKFSLDTVHRLDLERSVELNEDDYLNDQDERSTRSPYNQEEQQSIPDAIEPTNLTPLQVKTTTLDVQESIGT